MPDLAVSVDIEKHHTVVHVRGEIDLATADLLEAMLDQALIAGARWVEADLTRVPFMDCSGLGVLIGAKQRLQQSGGTLTLSGLGPAVQRLLWAAGLDHRLDTTRASAHGR
ncbi:STAS domain-containing protein (plasmid) [Streptosporangium sp. CA-135522]|uniref:STAS domain-containing protein n=1 Tax=Streptosporangium sp. CA-135522 TaxID=3240072 RepID=UPI003D92F52F